MAAQIRVAAQIGLIVRLGRGESAGWAGCAGQGGAVEVRVAAQISGGGAGEADSEAKAVEVQVIGWRLVVRLGRWKRRSS